MGEEREALGVVCKASGESPLNPPRGTLEIFTNLSLIII